MNKIKKIVSKYFKSFTYFYIQLRNKLFLFVFLSILVGILDSFGIAMFMPLLELISNADKGDGQSLGNLKFLIDAIQSIGLSLNLVTVLLLMVLFFILKGAVKFITFAYLATIQEFFIRNIRLGILSDFNRIRYKYFINSDIGRIQNTLTTEVERVSNAFRFYSHTIEQGMLIVIYIIFAFFVDFKFAILVTGGGLLTNILYKTIYKHTKGASSKFTKDAHAYQGQIIQYIANFKYLKGTGSILDYAKWLRKSIILIEKSRKKIGILNAILLSAREPLLIIVIAVVIIIQTMLIESILESVLISLLFFYRALASLMAMQNNWNKFLEMSGSLENIIDFQKSIKKQKENNGSKAFEKFNFYILLKDIDFSYNTTLILNKINLEIKRNETIAIVGESGSGKTTLVNILTGLIPVDNGTFLIDGYDVHDLDIITFQKRIGYITQEPVIFNDTIFNNITFWAEPNSENIKRFYYTLLNSALKEFVSSLPAGKDTLLGNNGINISGGQKQRISIARELYKDIDILIMDEATSSLDSETEQAIQQSIDHLKGKYTIIIIAHRLSTIKNADRIVFLSNTKIKDVASYNVLLNTNDKFRRMVEMQEI
jgi:ABC-type multidrug transport system fused ATPase/permease subunit